MSHATTNSIPYRADLDGIRGLAIGLVLAYHVAPSLLPGGFSGVDVFFVLSGYLITRILLADHDPGKVRRFYGRRLRRLVPALVLVLGFTLLVGRLTLLEEAFQRLAQHTAASAGFVANFVFWSEAGYFDADALDKPLLHLWSLGIEEQFYLAWPAMVWMALGRGGRRRRVLALAALAGGASFLACMIWVQRAPDSAFYLPWFRAWQPLAGAALALALGGRTLESSRAGSIFGWAGLASVLCGAAVLGNGRAHPDIGALLPVLGTAAMIAAGERTSMGRALSWGPLVGLGQVSYALYLWHWPLLSLFGDPRPQEGLTSRIVLCLVAWVLAALSTRWIERPIRIAKGTAARRWTGRLAALLILCVVLGLAASRTSGDLAVPRHPRVERIGKAMDLDQKLREEIPDRSCAELGLEQPENELFCRIAGEESLEDPIVLWGDSVAKSWWPAIHAVASAEDRPAVVLSYSGCPPLLGVRSGVYGHCRIEDAEQKAQLIESLAPSRIFIAARWGAYAGPTDDPPPTRHYISAVPATLPGSPEAGGPIDIETTRSALEARLPLTFDWLAQLAPTTVIAAVPDLVTSLPRAALLDLDPRRSPRSHRDQQAFVRSLLDAVVATNPNLRLVDPAPRLCGDTHCDAVLGDTFIYEDDNHVSAQGSLLFVDFLK